MQEVLRYVLPEEESRRWKTFYNKEINKYEIIKKEKATLEGTCGIPPELPLEAREIVREMRRPTDVSEVSFPDATFPDFKENIKKIHEKRSSSPSGQHYGHYKVLLTSEA